MESLNQRIDIREHQPAQVPQIARQFRSLYSDVYAEPPYYETESDVINFEARLTSDLHEPSFLMISAWCEDSLAGYIYGFSIDRNSSLWATVFLSPDPGQQVQEWTYPVVFVSELLVAAKYRRQGTARALHDRFLTMRGEPKAVLLAHPDAVAAQSAYRHWGWCRIGAGRPFPSTPIYDTLVKDLPSLTGNDSDLPSDVQIPTGSSKAMVVRLWD